MNDTQALGALLSYLKSERPLPRAQQAPSPFILPSVAPASLHTQPDNNVRAILEEIAKSPQGTEMLASLDANTLSLCLKYLGTGEAPRTTSVAASGAVAPSFFPPSSTYKNEPKQWLEQILAASAVAGNQPVASSQSLAGIVPSLLLNAQPANILPPPPLQDQETPFLSAVNSGTNPHVQGDQEEAARTNGAVDNDSEVPDGGKREKHLAANRVYAQRCRKRKKQYFEHLKVENEELRKLNQILEVVPDLILSFDSSGTIRFVTKSSIEFLGRNPKELRGSSFWRLLSTHSAKRLKNAFMDSLAKRKEGSSVLSLGDRVWEITLKDLSTSPLLLRGKIYFQRTEGTPECVCSIHHKDYERTTKPAVSALLSLRCQNDSQLGKEKSVQGEVSVVSQESGSVELPQGACHQN